jgi:hypothetical protein
MNFSKTRTTIKLISALLLVVTLLVAFKFYEAAQFNRHLVEKYASQRLETTPNSVFITEQPEDQLAASSGTSIKQPVQKPAPAAIVFSATSPSPTSTVPAVVTPDIKPAQAVVTGIAAGYVLSTMNERQIRDYFSEMNKLGLTWVRFDMDWSRIQSAGPTSYKWTEIDTVVRLANEYNIQILAILGYAPKWAAKENCVSGHLCAPNNPESFGNFASVAVNRYKDSIWAWEIWNEPNMNYFWSPKANGTEYAKVLRVGYSAIKSAQPEALVVSGGLSPVTNSGTTVNPLVFIEQIYLAGGKGYFDAVGHHPYTYSLSPSSILPWNHWYQMYKIYDIMNLNGDAGKKIWITEFGAPTGGAGSGRELGAINFSYGRDYLTQNAQAETMTALINEAAKISEWLGPVFWYSLVDINSNSSDPEGHFGLITSNNKYKPAYNILLNKR